MAGKENRRPTMRKREIKEMMMRRVEGELPDAIIMASHARSHGRKSSASIVKSLLSVLDRKYWRYICGRPSSLKRALRASFCGVAARLRRAAGMPHEALLAEVKAHRLLAARPPPCQAGEAMALRWRPRVMGVSSCGHGMACRHVS